jgi:hypothetical protein
MNEAEIKLKIIRLIDTQQGQILQELYEMLLNKLNMGKTEKKSHTLESAYKEMSQDEEREKEAFEWIEGTINFED